MFIPKWQRKKLHLSRNWRNRILYKNILYKGIWSNEHLLNYPKIKLNIRKIIRHYYQIQTKKIFQKFYLLSKKHNLSFGEYLERKLDVLLYRIHWTISIKISQKIIKKEGVLINQQWINNPNYLVQIGDTIQLMKIDDQPWKIIGKEKFLNHLKYIPPYIEIDIFTVTGTLIRKPIKEWVIFPWIWNQAWKWSYWNF